MHFSYATTVRTVTTVALLACLPGIASCSSNSAKLEQNQLPTVQVSVGQYRVTAELANTEETRQTGLMNREYLPNNNGMLFVFARTETQCMWMKNTLIDLDVAFADEQGRILNVEQMKAGTTDIHCSQGNARLALEMNLNWFTERRLGQGDIIKMPAQ
ncbi:DUF192 domain-containing protein [Limnobacter parvus]|uniref:DUF192 domain-containing protein n=1 Tax=Limnobacter parvus TaxID=2939690 RepID=A0ABT1XKF3_9BURK|nr:DUF192 domain-containing protein [Limnobacter parvus]MCR2747777.1 DUF192 domain-containing protein [Limnobacter parvus]